MTEKLEILFWNCHSLYTKLPHFKVKLYALKPHIVCLCETWLKENRLPTFLNYKSYFSCRPNRPGGGLAILVRNDVCVNPLTLNKHFTINLEVQAVTVFGGNQAIDILNIYNPCKDISVSEFNFYFNQLGKNKVIIGDFNAHSYMWDDRSIDNYSGDSLCEVLVLDPDLCLLTPFNMNTYYHVASRKFSTLDLCVVNSDLFPQSDICLAEDMGSDHSPIRATINFTPSITPQRRRPRYKFGDQKMWEKWRRQLPDCGNGNLPLEQSYAAFTQNLLIASDEIFTKTKEVINPKFCKPWWNEKCASAVADRRHKKNIFHKHPTVENLIKLRKSEAIAKRTTKKAKKDSFVAYSNRLNKDTPITEIWKQIGKQKKKSKIQCTLYCVTILRALIFAGRNFQRTNFRD